MLNHPLSPNPPNCAQTIGYIGLCVAQHGHQLTELWRCHPGGAGGIGTQTVFTVHLKEKFVCS